MAGKFQQFFPFLPDHSTWENFNGNLVLYYAAEGIPYTIETEWKTTAKNVTQSARFSGYLVSDPELFSSWQDWAREFGLIINGKPTH